MSDDDDIDNYARQIGSWSKNKRSRHQSEPDVAFGLNTFNLQSEKITLRNPLDAAPFDVGDMQQMNSESFPSIFIASADDTTMGGQELKHLFTRMNALISQALSTKTSPADVVNMVDMFYRTQIKSQFTEAPEWSRYHIYRFIFSDLDKQTTENINAVQNVVEFLRNNTAEASGSDGVVKPNEVNIKLLLAATKAHSQLVDAQRRRDK